MSQSTSWRHVVILFFAGVAVSLQIGKVPGAVPVLKDEFALSLVAAGWIVSIFSLIAAFSGAGFGALSARFGQGRLVIAGMVFTALASLAGAFVHGQTLLLITRTAEGLGFIFTVVSVPLLIAAVTTPRDRNVAMGLWGAYMPLGTGMMMLIGAPLLEQIGWRGLWIMAGVLIGAAALAVLSAAREATRRMGDAPKPRLGEVFSVARRPGPLLLGAIFALYAGSHLVLIGFLPLILVVENNLSGPVAAAWVAGTVISNCIGNFAAGFALRHGVAPRTTLVLSALAMGLSVVFVYMDFSAAVRITAAFVFSVLGGLIPGTMFAIAPDHSPRIQQLSAVNGLMLQGSALGQLLMPPAFAALVAWYGSWSVAGPAGLAVMLVAAGLAIVLTALPRAAEAAPAPAQARRNGR